MLQTAQQKTMSPLRNIVFADNFDFKKKAMKYIDYDLMRRYKNQKLLENLEKDAKEFREWADVKNTVDSFLAQGN